jgi:two-component system response regulator HydG
VTAFSAVQNRPFDLVLMDIRMINMSGIEALSRIKAFNPAIPVIIMTAYASVETAVETLKKGAYDYLTKPLDFDELHLSLERAMEHSRLKEENRILKESLGERFDRRHLIGRSSAITRLLDTTAQVAPSEATVLLTGESGTGKEMIAGLIHFNSLRRENPFIKINCAAISETLLESEFFGHERGAFTGADRRREGKFRQADGGTLFLDEVSEMSLGMQAKLLRVIQEREITRVGGEDVIKIDVRLIAATNRDLLKEVSAVHFREDLFYRLNVVTLRVPPLRERMEDIPLLSQFYLNRFAEKNHKTVRGFTPQAMDRLLRHTWPGNVRELMNSVERGVVLSQGDFLEEALLGLCLPEDLQGTGPIFSPSADKATTPLPEIASLEEVERQTILQTLVASRGNKSAAARNLGVTRRTLHQKLRKYGMM